MCRRRYFGATTHRGWTDMASSGMRIGTEPIDMKTRFLARIAAFVTAAAAMAMFLAPATSSELNATPQRDGVYLAAID
jgi:hypothetical protein